MTSRGRYKEEHAKTKMGCEYILPYTRISFFSKKLKGDVGVYTPTSPFSLKGDVGAYIPKN
jgi:hypothetical protein